MLIARFITLTLAMPVIAQSPLAPEVTLQLSSDRILLGEPVWVLVTIVSVAPVPQTRVLVILPRDDAVLLAREKQMAAEIEAEMLRAVSFRDGVNLGQVRRGLAAHPAPGMEPVFEHWLQLPNDFESDAILGLKNLNTPASRAALATLAKTRSKPNSYTQDAATAALADLGDRQYYPLMVQLLASPDERVRRAAVPGVANLGGEDGVARLLEMVRAGGGNGLARDAVTALGNTKSRTAVKGLIDAMPRTEGPDAVEAEWPLFVLTHHRLPNVDVLRTPEQTHQAWLQWWEATGNSAPVYSPFECAPGARGPIR